ncbi:AMP-binding protein [Labilibaculum sp. A4]|uniref:AMP-binding protein n=2 Tax=Labilibaculum euxinus TaxID=2686357 RepID=A0A425Y3D7_9BACT|nr:AMP-binding protein [Labilibaculum euxinus]MVB08115.1 AMP-binding protein [Labilibaculum euxinus]MWN78172.1 AMP-binding protein [Labilibaculum euxinus]
MMKQYKSLTFPALFSETAAKFGNCNAMALVGQTPFTYNEVYANIQALLAFFEKLGIKPGDKIALLSTNMPNWGMAYYATTFMGAVVVPMLPDFSQFEIENILSHSEAKAVFVSTGLRSKIKNLKIETLQSIIAIEDFNLIHTNESSPKFDLSEKPKQDYQVCEDDMAAIIYTSGTTGNSKGVMLSHKNICSNAILSKTIHPIDETDRFLSILPLSHTYENTLGYVIPMIAGSCIYYLGKAPVPSLLLSAFKEVRPTIMFSVPLIIEKIYRSKILPSINGKAVTKYLYKIPFFRKKLNAIAGKKLMETFGGKLTFFGIGGAKLNSKVELFLREAKFPYAIGYGLTETAPLIAGCGPAITKFQSTGPALVGVELKINNPDPVTQIGEVWAKGDNVMMGYYKEPEKTKEVLTEDGWFKTGDLAKMDKDNYLYIEGRLKNMIVGSSGENIYPEEIESVINNFKHVIESVVIEQKGKLVAMVHFNYEELEQQYQHLKKEVGNYVDDTVDELMQELQVYVNSRVNKFSQVQLVIAQIDPFQKTATHKIKRFLYH